MQAPQLRQSLCLWLTRAKLNYPFFQEASRYATDTGDGHGTSGKPAHERQHTRTPQGWAYSLIIAASHPHVEQVGAQEVWTGPDRPRCSWATGSLRRPRASHPKDVAG